MRILTTPDRLDMVRLAATSFVPLSQASVENVLPDWTITMPSFGGRAESMVIRAVPLDWPAILAGNAPVIYCAGDPIMAQAALIDAAVMYCCAFLNPVMQQTVLTEETPNPTSRRRMPNWQRIEQAWYDQAAMAMGILLGHVPVPALQLASPGVSLIDPAQVLLQFFFPDTALATESQLAIGPGTPFAGG